MQTNSDPKPPIKLFREISCLLCACTFCYLCRHITATCALSVQLGTSSCTLTQWHESCRMNCLIRKTCATIRGPFSLIFTTPLLV